MTQPNVETIRNLAELLEAQTQLMISQNRTLAAAVLAGLIAKSKGPETVRRACKDMLTIHVFGEEREKRGRGRPRRESSPAVHAQRFPRVPMKEPESEEVAAAWEKILHFCRDQRPDERAAGPGQTDVSRRSTDGRRGRPRRIRDRRVIALSRSSMLSATPRRICGDGFYGITSPVRGAHLRAQTKPCIFDGPARATGARRIIRRCETSGTRSRGPPGAFVRQLGSRSPLKSSSQNKAIAVRAQTLDENGTACSRDASKRGMVDELRAHASASRCRWLR